MPQWMPISAYTQRIDLLQSVFTALMSQRLCHELNLVCLLWAASHWRQMWTIDWSEGCPCAARTLNKGRMRLLHLIHLDPYISPLSDNGLCGRVLFSENEQVKKREGSKRWPCTSATSKNLIIILVKLNTCGLTGKKHHLRHHCWRWWSYFIESTSLFSFSILELN